MPTYEFRCEAGHSFDRFLKMSEAPLETACAECGKPATRQMSGGAGLVFKGSGFYLTDYGRAGQKPSGSDGAAAASSGEKPAGESKTGDTKAGDTKSGDTKSGDTKSGDTKSSDSKSSHSKSSHSKSSMPESSPSTGSSDRSGAKSDKGRSAKAPKSSE